MIGRLVNGIKQRKLSSCVNVIVVADHGMKLWFYIIRWLSLSWRNMRSNQWRGHWGMGRQMPPNVLLCWFTGWGLCNDHALIRTYHAKTPLPLSRRKQLQAHSPTPSVTRQTWTQQPNPASQNQNKLNVRIKSPLRIILTGHVKAMHGQRFLKASTP